MVQINFAQKTVNVKVVFYGPGMSGKTTNLEVVHQRAPETNRGELTSISTDGDRTLFFDYMPLDLGTVAGMRTCFQLYTVPGQVYYNSTRKLVLQGVDGIIFVADSSAAMLNQNLESLRNLEENLNEYGKGLSTLSHVIQLNKRDLPDAMSVEELARILNPHNVPIFEAIANTGQGVFPTLKALAAGVLKQIMNESGAKSAFPAPAPAAPAASAARPALDVGVPRPAVPGRQAGAPFAPAAHAGHGQGHHLPPPAHGAAGAHAGSGVFPGGAGGGRPQVSPMGAMPGPGPAPATSMGELQLALPGSGQRARPAPPYPPAASAVPPSPPRKAPAPERRPARMPSASTPAARPRAAQRQPSVSREKGSSRAGEIFTGLFVVVGAGVGAFLAWVVMTVL